MLTIPLTATGTITAKYNGDANYFTSTSTGVTVNVTSGPTFSLSASSNGQMTVSTPGQQATNTITVTGSGGFAGTVTLTVSGPTPSTLADPPSCSFGATGAITLSATTTTGAGTLTCNTTAAGAVFGPISRPHNPNWLPFGEAGAAIACMFLLGFAGKKRRGVALLAIALFAVVFVAMSCNGGGGGGGGITIPGTAAGTYTFTVTGTPSTGSAQTTTVTLTVQ